MLGLRGGAPAGNYTAVINCPILTPTNPVHTLPSYFFKIHFNIILYSAPILTKWCFSFKLPNRNPICVSSLPHTCLLPSLSYLH